jgi:DNA modification methylase
MGYALRNTFECFALTYRGGWQPRARDVPDVWRYPWSPGNRTLGHSAEKPVVMLRRAVSLLAAPGALVLDPFSGSGSTGEAALLEGCRFIGIEQDEEWCEVARSRLASIGEHGEAVSEAQPSLFEVAS